MIGNRLGRENRSLKATGINGCEGPVFELLKKGNALLLTPRAEPGIASTLYPPLHIPGRLPMPRNVNINQWVGTPFSSSGKRLRSPQDLSPQNIQNLKFFHSHPQERENIFPFESFLNIRNGWFFWNSTQLQWGGQCRGLLNLLHDLR